MLTVGKSDIALCLLYRSYCIIYIDCITQIECSVERLRQAIEDLKDVADDIITIQNDRLFQDVYGRI